MTVRLHLLHWQCFCIPVDFGGTPRVCYVLEGRDVMLHAHVSTECSIDGLFILLILTGGWRTVIILTNDVCLMSVTER